eukprot:CAMPEP_0180185918 /NCGR_PEP_ID=MMETSP0986-20121125/42669_1 /TAXON_ID=697907 /ORGANISM="non described non described, Strain CCMP2293" /LENGTH=74 /DNA_ID=CAMNT_0022139813 /DNA_START=63 /DNA_END=283 /DNA_ORIENTATION=+
MLDTLTHVFDTRASVLETLTRVLDTASVCVEEAELALEEVHLRQRLFILVLASKEEKLRPPGDPARIITHKRHA